MSISASTRPEVVVIGAGIGGLCLAQGLHAAGVPVRVYERDGSPGSRWEGYRIHINPPGPLAAGVCLTRCGRRSWPPPGPAGDFGFLTEWLTELVVIEESITYPNGAAGSAEDHYAVDRGVALAAAGLPSIT